MAEKSIFTKKELNFLKELKSHNISFMIVGLSAAALQGAPVVTQDIDIWFKDVDDPSLKKVLRKLNATYVPLSKDNPPLIVGEQINLFDIVTCVHGVKSFEEELVKAVDIRIGRLKIKVLNLKSIIKSKKYLNREKDKLVIPVLEDVLLTLQNSPKT